MLTNYLAELKNSVESKINSRYLQASILCSTLAVCFASRAHAVPVINENASISQYTTIFPDHTDPNLFYIAPNAISLCLDSAGAPRFSYLDVSTNSGTQGIVQMTLCARYNDREIAAARSAISANSSAARFVALPIFSSKVTFDSILTPFIIQDFCTHRAGRIEDEQACSFRLTMQGRRVFLAQIRDRLAMTMPYEYSVSGFIRKPEGGFDARIANYGIAIRIGGEELKTHPELFRDEMGHLLKTR